MTTTTNMAKLRYVFDVMCTMTIDMEENPQKTEGQSIDEALKIIRKAMAAPLPEGVVVNISQNPLATGYYTPRRLED